MTAPRAFCDVETTGLHADRHDIWEVGLIVDDEEYRWLLDVDLEAADPIALSIGRFHERHPRGNAYRFPAELGRDEDVTGDHDFAVRFAQLTHGRHLVGAVISFDEERLRRLLLRSGVHPSWHYHLIDCEALAAGWVAAQVPGDTMRIERPDGTVNHIDGRPPWDSTDLSRAVGVEPDTFDKHTALGDARWAAAVYRAVMGES